MNYTQFLADNLKRAADGEFGPKVKSIYWWVHDRASTWGVVAGLADIALKTAHHYGVCAQCSDWDMYLLTTCLFLTNSGMMLGFHAAEQPEASKKE